MFKVLFTTNERWIFISSPNGIDEPEDFIEFLKKYRFQLQGEVKSISFDMQYIVSNDPLNLIFQWDSCFGITVIVPESTDFDVAQCELKKLCESLNQ